MKSGNKASKLSNRIAAEGCVLININDNCTKAVIMEINCETDFVGQEINHSLILQVSHLTNFLKWIHPINSIINKETENEIESMRKQLVMKLARILP